MSPGLRFFLLSMLLLASPGARPASELAACHLKEDEAIWLKSYVEHEANVIESIGARNVLDSAGKYLLIDVRGAGNAGDVRIPGAIEVNPAQLRAMASTSSASIAVMGTGYDDHRLSGRIGQWADSAGDIRIVRGGAAGMLAARSDSVSDLELGAVLGVSVDAASILAVQPDLKVLALDGFSESTARRWFQSVSAPGGQDNPSVEQIEAAVFEAEQSHTGELLLLSRDEALARDRALALTRSLSRPVFFVRGDAEDVHRHLQHFASSKRKPVARNWSCR